MPADAKNTNSTASKSGKKASSKDPKDPSNVPAEPVILTETQQVQLQIENAASEVPLKEKLLIWSINYFIFNDFLIYLSI